MTWLALILILAATLFIWLVRKPESLDDEEPLPPEIDGVDAEELARAEREVQMADSPDDVQDWGPGTSKPPL